MLLLSKTFFGLVFVEIMSESRQVEGSLKFEGGRQLVAELVSGGD